MRYKGRDHLGKKELRRNPMRRLHKKCKRCLVHTSRADGGGPGRRLRNSSKKKKEVSFRSSGDC